MAQASVSLLLLVLRYLGSEARNSMAIVHLSMGAMAIRRDSNSSFELEHSGSIFLVLVFVDSTVLTSSWKWGVITYFTNHYRFLRWPNFLDLPVMKKERAM